jgi:hypothetical protein
MSEIDWETKHQEAANRLRVAGDALTKRLHELSHLFIPKVVPDLVCNVMRLEARRDLGSTHEVRDLLATVVSALDDYHEAQRDQRQARAMAQGREARAYAVDPRIKPTPEQALLHAICSKLVSPSDIKGPLHCLDIAQAVADELADSSRRKAAWKDTEADLRMKLRNATDRADANARALKMISGYLKEHGLYNVDDGASDIFDVAQCVADELVVSSLRKSALLEIARVVGGRAFSTTAAPGAVVAVVKTLAVHSASLEQEMDRVCKLIDERLLVLEPEIARLNQIAETGNWSDRLDEWLCERQEERDRLRKMRPTTKDTQ